MPLPFSRRASQTAPSFSRDFAGLKTLDHGVGPAITFTRADATTCATFFDANGVLQLAAANVPRFDHDPATGASRGLLIEESRTNSIRNAQAGGATAGVIGSGGALPTNWTSVGAGTLAVEVIGTGTVSGFSYVDIKLSGTTSTTSTTIGPESQIQVVASSGQTWTTSAYVSLIAGSTSNISEFRLTIRDNDINGSSLGFSNTTFTPTATLTRLSHTRTLSNASTERTGTNIGLTFNSGATIDITLRIAAPQLEQGAFPTSYIPTTSAAATRSSDSAVVTPISSFYNQAEGTLFAELQAQTLTQSGGFARRVVTLDNNTTDDEVNISQSGTADQLSFIVRQSAAASAVIVGGSSITSITKAIGAYATNNAQASYNGTLGTADTSVTVPTTLTHLKLGRSTSSTARLFQGHIRKVAYWPKRLTNTLLEQLTT
jgi:hypothetical protein